jgi:hypothetical protein
MKRRPLPSPGGEGKKFNFRISEFCLTTQKLWIIRIAVPSHSKGRIAIVTDAGRNAVDADVPLTNGTEADGQVVWS